MADKSAIQWTDATWNPVTGCSKVSPGCAHCYAETLTARYAGSKGWIEEHRPWTPENAEHNVLLHPERLEQPLRWRRPRMVFVNSMSDLFHELIPDEFILKVFSVMGSARHHTFQVLTKRPDRARDLLRRLDWDLLWEPRRDADELVATLRPADHWTELDETTGPLPNVWLGVSVENSRYTWRADVLREIPAAVRFVSAEPLLGSLLELRRGERLPPLLDERNVAAPLDLTAIDWLIAGGESGPGARPMQPDWARELRDACLDLGCSTCIGGERPCVGDYGCQGNDRPAFFFKQWGGRTPKAGGRELDGREWNEMPA